MRTSVMTVLLGVAGLVLTGCTSIVSPHVSEAEFLTSEAKLAGRAELYVTEEFRTYSQTKTNVMDMKKWQFELGPVAVDAFKYDLASHFEKVDVKLGTPSFPLADGGSGSLVVAVEPAFTGLSTHFPFAFKFETYVARVSFAVKAYDQSGNLLVDKVYQGIGKKRGAVGFESPGYAANPVAAQLAVKDAVHQAVEDILASVRK